jgi:hypothetical protein
LVIHGRQDRVVPEDAGHCFPIEQPQAFTAVMRLWLTR